MRDYFVLGTSSVEIQGTVSSSLLCLYSCLPSILHLLLAVLSFLCPYGCCIVVLAFWAVVLWSDDPFSFHGNFINQRHIISTCPVWSCILLYIIPVRWTSYYIMSFVVLQVHIILKGCLYVLLL